MERRANDDECEQQATKRKTDKTSEVVRCGLEFYDQPCEDLARAMLGCVLVCRGEAGEECRGEVVEVEAYLGGEDRAAHSFGGRRTAANEAMFMVRTRRLVGIGRKKRRALFCSPQVLPMSTPYMESTTASMCPVEDLGQQCWCERCVLWQDWRP